METAIKCMEYGILFFFLYGIIMSLFSLYIKKEKNNKNFFRKNILFFDILWYDYIVYYIIKQRSNINYEKK